MNLDKTFKRQQGRLRIDGDMNWILKLTSSMNTSYLSQLFTHTYVHTWQGNLNYMLCCWLDKWSNVLYSRSVPEPLLFTRIPYSPENDLTRDIHISVKYICTTMRGRMDYNKRMNLNVLFFHIYVSEQSMQSKFEFVYLFGKSAPMLVC